MTGKNPLGNSREPQAYEGNNIVVPVGGWQLIKSRRAPNTNDKKYPIGSIWINTATSTSYQLVAAPGVWTVLGTGTGGDIQSLTGDSGGAILPAAGNITLAGTANQITTTGAGSTITFSLPAAITAPGSLTTTTSLAVGTSATVGTTLGVTGATTLAALTQVGTANINATGAAVTTIGTGGTGAVNIGNATGNTAVTGSLTASTSLTATLGNITATNGNHVFGTAGNKIVSTSVGTTTAAGANSFGTVTLSGGTATIATTAVTASSIIMLTRQSVGATGANPLGMLGIGTIVAATSFVINANTTANSGTLVATDVSVVGWMIIN